MISVRNVFKIFGKKESAGLELAQQGAGKADILRDTGCHLALRDVSLDIEEGKVFVLMGLSGSGKSTLIRHLNRLIEPSAGDIQVDGRDIRALDAAALRDFRRRQVSMVFQGFGLLPHMTVRDNVALGLSGRGEPRIEAHARADDWIERVALKGYGDSYPGELSGGMKQRVGLARALATETPVLLMDEAFNALDPLIRADMQDLLLDLQKSLSKTVVFVTHDLAEAVRLGDTIAILRDGAMVQSGAPRDILDHPADDYVTRFVEVSRR